MTNNWNLMKSFKEKCNKKKEEIIKGTDSKENEKNGMNKFYTRINVNMFHRCPKWKEDLGHNENYMRLFLVRQTIKIEHWHHL